MAAPHSRLPGCFRSRARGLARILPPELEEPGLAASIPRSRPSPEGSRRFRSIAAAFDSYFVRGFGFPTPASVEAVAACSRPRSLA